MALYEDHKTKIGMKKAVIRRIHFFMLLNTLLLPVTETSSAIVLFNDLTHTDIEYWPEFLSANLMNQQYFYIKFII